MSVKSSAATGALMERRVVAGPLGAIRSLGALRHRAGDEELLDQPGLDTHELTANLRDIQRVNRFFGGTRTVLRYLPALVATVPADRPLTVLDLATGAADIPRAVVDWGRRHGRAVHVTASDWSDDILAVATEQTVNYPEITFARCDARALPFPDASFNLVLCSLALHHFAPPDAVAVLREIDRLAVHGFIVNDLVRSRRGFVATWLASRVTTRNRLTRHDAPLSIRRAYTPTELRALLADAGIHDARIRRHPWFRMAATEASGVRRLE